MDENDWRAERFEENRTHLRAVAYRMLGSLSEADDAVQEAWLRLSRSDTSDIENLSGWLTTVVARVSLDMLRSRKSRREEPLDAHIPDPIVSRARGIDPEHEALLADLGRSCTAGETSKRWLPPSGSPSCSTICSPCPSTRSRRSWGGPRPRPDSSPAAHAAGYRERPLFPTPISPASDR